MKAVSTSEDFRSIVGTALKSLDTERLLEHYADDGVFESAATGKTFKGRDALRVYFTRLFSQPGVQFKVSSVLICGELGVAEWRRAFVQFLGDVGILGRAVSFAHGTCCANDQAS